MIATYLPFWLFVGVVAGIYIIMSLGLYLQFALTGLPNFGHSAFMSLAAYSMAIAVIRFGVSLPVASVIGLMMAAAFGLLLGIPVLRLSGDYLAIVTIAASEIIRYLAINIQDLTVAPSVPWGWAALMIFRRTARNGTNCLRKYPPHLIFQASSDQIVI